MNFASLLLLAPLATGTHPGKSCDAGNCPPAQMPRLLFRQPMPVGPLIAQPCPPLAPAPLLAVKFTLPEGVRVVTMPGTTAARTELATGTFGFRPGYVYRVQLTGLPNRPDESLYPEIEVRGTLAPRPGMNYMDYPAAIAFGADDLAKAAAGSLLTKVVYLEDPEKAVPAKTTADRPLEQIADTDEDAIRAAADGGRIVLVVRLGNRVPTADDLKRVAVPNTILHPGEGKLAGPAVPPPLAWAGVPLYDPISGPKPRTEECLTDGGDTKNPLGIRDDGELGGLDSTDVALEYTQAAKRKVATSNKVCICVPRFAVQKVELNPKGLYFAYRLQSWQQREASSAARTTTLPQAVSDRLKPVGLELPIRAMEQVGRQGAEVILSASSVQATFNFNGTQVVKSAVEPDELVNFPNEMVVTKAVEPKSGVKIGDEVTFTLTYKNDTALAVSDLVLSDNLSPRLEYVAGSGLSDRPTNLTISPNASGSSIVKFEIPGTLQPGQGGVVKFKAKVR
jgi:uncharacterized repeat protein (TIGR01451 family)